MENEANTNDVIKMLFIADLENRQKQLMLAQELNGTFAKSIEFIEQVYKTGVGEFENAEDRNVIVLNNEETKLLVQALAARKKALRGKIRNNEKRMMKLDDGSGWSESDYMKAINLRKMQMAEADMLKVRFEQLMIER